MSIEIKYINNATAHIVLKISPYNNSEEGFDDSVELKNIDWDLNVQIYEDILFCDVFTFGSNNIWKAKIKTVSRFVANDQSIVRCCSSEFDLNSFDLQFNIFSFENISKIPDHYVTNGEIRLEWDFEILEISGNYPDRRISFWEPNYLSNTMLKVGDKEFHVNKDILSCSSTVFEKMLSSEMAENQVVHLTIENEPLKNFVTFLNLLYGHDSMICERSALQLLVLAQQFDTPVLTQKCEQFFLAVSNNVVSLEKKKAYAEKYGLKDLAQKCELEEKSNQSILSGIFSYFSGKFYN